MGWQTNALGIYVDQSTDANYAELKRQGAGFVVIDLGTGFTVNQNYKEQLLKAKAAGLGAVFQYAPYPALDDYTFEALPREQAAQVLKWITGLTFSGLIISLDRYWTGLDLETGHAVRQATDTAISNVGKVIAETVKSALDKQQAASGGPAIPVLVRTNDPFVQKYAPSLGSTAWTDKFGFDLNDYRVRVRAADGSWSVYVEYTQERVPVADITALRVLMPSDKTKNPPVPGSTPQLKLWEVSSNRFVLPTDVVKGYDGKEKRLRVILFNGDDAAMRLYFPYVAGGTTPPPVDPGTDPGTNPGSGDTTELSKALGEMNAAVQAMRVDVAAIRTDLADVRTSLAAIRSVFK